MKPSDHHQLQKIIQLWRQLELSYKDQFPEGPLMNLKVLISDLQLSSDPQIQKLSEVVDHLHPQMNERHFLNYLVPFERAMGRNLNDSDVMITTIDRKATELPRRPLIFILDNLRSAFNVGSIFRLGDAVGCEKIFLCGYTPTPENEQVTKTSLGSQKSISFEAFKDLPTALQAARALNYQIVALETAQNSTGLYEGPLPERCALVVGNERFGLDYPSLPLCDQVRTIPQFGIKNSLNVAVALGIAAYEWQRQWPVKSK